MPEPFPVSDRTRLVREANRAVYDREAIYKILDEGFVCHVGFAAEGQPFVIPTMFARVGRFYLFSRLCSEPHASWLKRGPTGVHYGHAFRWPRACPVNLQSLHELPLRGRSRPCHGNR